MKKSLLTAALIIVMTISLSAKEISPANACISGTEKIVRHACVADLSLELSEMIQKLTKDYLYKGMGASGRSLNREIEETTAALQKVMQEFGQYRTDDHGIQRQLTVMLLAEGEFESLVREKYSQENMQLLLDLSAVTSETARSILASMQKGAEVYKKDSKARMPRLSTL